MHYRHSERLKIFIKLCYEDKPYRVAKMSGINLMTLKKWMEGGDMKLSSINKLSNAGINISWLVSGMGTMFAHNDIGKKLKEDNEIREKIKSHFKDSYDNAKKSITIDLLIENASKFQTQSERVNFILKELPNWYKKINDNSTNTMTNYFLYVWPELFRSEKDKELLSPNERDTKEKSKEYIKDIFPFIFAYAIDYLGKDIHSIFDNLLPGYIDNLLLGIDDTENTNTQT